MNRRFWGAVALVLVGGLAGCGKSPQEMGCADSEVQLNARKLLAMRMQEWQQPQQASRLGGMDDMRKTSPEAAAALNGFRARSVRPDGIELSAVEQLSAPQTPLVSADADESFLPVAMRSQPTGNKRLYSCKAVARIKLPRAVATGLPETTRKVLDIGEEGIQAVVLFETQLTPDNDLWVAAGFGNPLVEIAMRSLLARSTEEN